MKAESGRLLVLWNFARLLRSTPRAPAIEPEDEARDAPPERFVEKISDEGGDVYFSPVLDALRETLRSKRTPNPSGDAPQEGTPASRTERP